MREMDRRTFLATGGLALAGLTTACKKKIKPLPLPSHATLDQLVGVAKKQDQEITVVQAVESILVQKSSRVSFDLTNSTNTAQYTGGSLQVWAAPVGSTQPAIGPVRGVYHGEGLGAQGVYVARI